MFYQTLILFYTWRQLIWLTLKPLFVPDRLQEIFNLTRHIKCDPQMWVFQQPKFVAQGLYTLEKKHL